MSEHLSAPGNREILTRVGHTLTRKIIRPPLERAKHPFCSLFCKELKYLFYVIKKAQDSFTENCVFLQLRC